MSQSADVYAKVARLLTHSSNEQQNLLGSKRHLCTAKNEKSELNIPKNAYVYDLLALPQTSTALVAFQLSIV
jgi:hypothetical protein